jgi:hypothetical protein
MIKSDCGALDQKKEGLSFTIPGLQKKWKGQNRSKTDCEGSTG